MTTRVPRRRRISELYALGVPLTLDDGDTEWVPKLDDEGNPVTELVTDAAGAPVLDDNNQPVMRDVLVEEVLPPEHVWVAKLSDIEMTTALKKAARAKATMLATIKDHDTDDWQAIHQEMSNLDRDVWIGILVDHELTNSREVIEARIAGETVLTDEGEEEPGEWAKDGYLEGLYDAWRGGLDATFAVDPEDPEAARVLNEIMRFNELVEHDLAYERDTQVSMFQAFGDDMLLEKVTDHMVQAEAESAWSDEYRLRVIFLAARQCDGPDPQRKGKCRCRGAGRKHAEFLFESYEEVVVTDVRIRSLIYGAFNSVMVDIREGKGLRGMAGSSTPSVSPAAEGISTSSGPTVATA